VALRKEFARPRASFVVEAFRHGESINNALGLVSGGLDIPLTVLGEEQASALGAQLTGRYDFAFHSGMSRSDRTLSLALAASSASASRVRLDERLRERKLGALEGRPSISLPPYDNGDLLYAPQGGEAYISVARRVLSFLLDLARFAEKADEESRFLVSTHAGPLRLLLGVLANHQDAAAVLTTQYPNASLIRVRVDGLCFPRFVEDALRTQGE
jgi:probable phosphoglycerate mutase